MGVLVQLSKLTHPYVLRAIDECDNLGREEFLATYGFAKAHEYFLLHGARAYDSKAIVGFAYSLMTGEKYNAKDFSGGRVLADRLRLLGFEVTGDMDWKLEEQVLACDLLYQNNWLTIPERDPRIVQLSTSSARSGCTRPASPSTEALTAFTEKSKTFGPLTPIMPAPLPAVVDSRPKSPARLPLIPRLCRGWPSA